MISLFSSNYLPRSSIARTMEQFAKGLQREQTVVDLGCGNKPYASLFQCKYIGVDPFPGTKADVIADAWNTKLPASSADAVILNQSLEHIPETTQTITEISRILKPGGLVLVTVPQTMRNHGIPIPAANAPFHHFDPEQTPYWNHDYWRFTKFGLLYLFRNFHIETIKETHGYLATLLQLTNYYFSSFGLSSLFAPLYFINNVLAELSERLLAFQHHKKYYHLIHHGLTLNYILIAKKI